MMQYYQSVIELLDRGKIITVLTEQIYTWI